jgi:Tfp pilus assembly protein PilF
MIFRRLAPVALFAAAVLSGCQNSAPESMAAAEAAIAKHQYFDAQAALLAWREDNGASPENSALLAKVLIELGDGYTAERYLTELEPQRGTTPEWLSLRARSLILQGNPWRARELIERSGWTGAPEGEREYLLVWAAMEEGNTGQAIAEVDRALRLYPDHAGLNAKAARLAVWEDNWDAAERHIAAALAADPDQFEALLVLGEGQIADGDLEAALKTYRLAGKAYPDFAIPHANVAGLLLDLGRLDEADKTLGKALQAHPEFPLLRFNAARLAAMRGQWKVARAAVQALPTEWKRTFPATIMLEADIEAGLGNHAMASTLYAQLADDPRFAQQALTKRDALPAG